MSACVISGDVVDANGEPLPSREVGIVPVSQGNRPVFDADGRLVSMRSMSTVTDVDGHFALSVTQGVEIILTIGDIDYRKQFTVPAQASLNIKDI